ncbi:MAG: MopE-related protein [Myxococcota bacterium]|nr:MopE-related protein [Myxococcota bacterium]
MYRLLPLLTVGCTVGLDTTLIAGTDGDEGEDTTDTTTDGDGDGFSIEDGDCDDTDAESYPGGVEICDGADNDCDELIDEEDDDLTAGTVFYADADGDGYGDASSPRTLCYPILGYTQNTLDCDDDDPTEPVVVDQLTGSPTGLGSIDAPLETIQGGITTATSCVAVYPGTYTESVTFDGKDLYVFGVEGAEQTIIDATGQGSSVVRFTIAESEEAILEGFTLTGGTGRFSQETTSWACTSMYDCTEYFDIYCGGGVFISGADPTLRDLVITDNILPDAASSSDGIDSWYTDSYGGGICVENGTAGITDVTISGNHADQGGGVFVDLSSAVSLTRAWLSSNTATDGAGVMVLGGSLFATNTGFIGNIASDSGGCIATDEGGNITGNWLVMSQCSALEGGGAWVGPASTLSLTSSIAYQLSGGGGLAGLGSSSFSGTYNNLYDNIGADYIGLSEPTDGTSIALDPMFVSPVLPGDWHLSDGSPSIDAGSASATDLDGTRSDQGIYGGPESWAE